MTSGNHSPSAVTEFAAEPINVSERLHQNAHGCSWRSSRWSTAVPDEGGPLTTSTVKIIPATPRDITHGRYDHTTRLVKLI